MKRQLGKCELMKNKVEFIGFVVTEQEIETIPNKVTVIRNYLRSKNLKDLRSFPFPAITGELWKIMLS